MSEEVVSRPIYELSSSERLKDALAQLPPHPRQQQGHPDAVRLHTQFEVLDALNGRVLVQQFFQDTHSDRPCEGVGSYYRSFRRGQISPEGDVVVLSNQFGWRQAIIEYHGGWIMTVMNEKTHGISPDERLPPTWIGGCLAGLEDKVLAAEIISAYLQQGLPPTFTLKDFLLFCHDIHRRKVVASFHDPKILYV